MGNSYTALGRWFEYLNKDCGYEQWSQYLIDILRKNGACACGLDIGCGNGYFTRALTKAGYLVTGIDISAQMLDTAQQLSLKEGVRAEFLLGDITKLRVNVKQDFCIAINDCINYVPKNKLKCALSRVHAALKKGGLFVFDISSANKLKNIIGNNLFAEDNEDISFLWFNTLSTDSVTMDVTLFERQKNGSYLRFDEKHIQYIYEEDEILSALQAAGFAAEACGHLGKDKRERINFICIRQ